MTTEQTPAAPETATPPAASKYICGYAPIARLYSAAAEAMRLHRAHHDDENRNAFDDAMTALEAAIAGVEEASRDAAALYDSVTAQVGRVGSQDGDVDVIGDFTHHNGNEPGDGGGWWVDAWVWVEDGTEVCRLCGADLSHDEGSYQGACGSCSDKAEERGAEKAARAIGWTRDGPAARFTHGDHIKWGNGDETWMDLCSDQEIAYEPIDPEQGEGAASS